MSGDNTMSVGARRDYGKGVAAAFSATVLWSLSGVFVRHLESTNPAQINAWRAMSMTVVLVVFLLLLYGRETGRRFNAMQPVALMASAGFFAAGSTLYLTALTLAPVANVTVLSATSPIFAAILGHFIARETPGARGWIAALLAVAGVAVIFRDGLAAGNWLGNIVSLVVAFAFAGQTVVLRRFRQVDMLPAMCVGGVAVFLLLGVAAGNLAIGARDFWLVMAMGVVQLAAPIILFVRAARYIPAMHLSLISLLDVVLNPLWTWIGVGEMPAPGAFIGGTVIVAAVLLTILAHRHAAAKPKRAL